jgi:hypothetical protein
LEYPSAVGILNQANNPGIDRIIIVIVLVVIVLRDDPKRAEY